MLTIMAPIGFTLGSFVYFLIRGTITEFGIGAIVGAWLIYLIMLV